MCDGSQTCAAEVHLLGCFRSPKEREGMSDKREGLSRDSLHVLAELEKVLNERDEARADLVRYREALTWSLDCQEILWARLEQLAPEAFVADFVRLCKAGIAKGRAALGDEQDG